MNNAEPLRRRTLLAAGMTDAEIKGAVRRGELIPLTRGAYLDAAAYRELQRHERYRAKIVAVSAASPGLLVSHSSAAALHGLDLYDLDLTRVHLTRIGHGGGRRTRHRWVHSGRLVDGDVRARDGLRLTSVARTVIDVARTESLEAAVVVADSAVRRDLVSAEDLAGALSATDRSTGRPRAERALAVVDGRSESAGESRLRLQLAGVPLPPPDLQVEVFDERGRLVGRADAGYLAYGVLIEFDGLAKYQRLLCQGQSAADAVIKEKRREELISELGWLVLRFIWRDLERPAVVADRVHRACLARRRFVGAIRGRAVPRPARTV